MVTRSVQCTQAIVPNLCCRSRWLGEKRSAMPGECRVFRELLPTVDRLQTQEADDLVGFLSRA